MTITWSLINVLYLACVSIIVLTTFLKWKEWWGWGGNSRDRRSIAREKQLLAIAWGGTFLLLILLSWRFYLTGHGGWAAMLFAVAIIIWFAKLVHDWRHGGY